VEHKEIQLWQRWNVMVNVLLIMTLLLIMAGIAWGLDTQDIVAEWTPEGKKLSCCRQSALSDNSRQQRNSGRHGELRHM
jgi:hypothetical protein